MAADINVADGKDGERDRVTGAEVGGRFCHRPARRVEDQSDGQGAGAGSAGNGQHGSFAARHVAHYSFCSLSTPQRPNRSFSACRHPLARLDNTSAVFL